MRLRTRTILSVAAAAVLAAAGALPCRAQLFDTYHPMYFIGGVPLKGPVDKTTASLKFQFSTAIPFFKNISGREGMDLTFEYSQVSVWDFFDDSSPFRDNIYIPEFYLCIPYESDLLRFGIGHWSNGRPMRGSTDDTYSRSVNYAFCEYRSFLSNGLVFKALVRGGIGWYDEELTQEVFWRFMGYADFTGGYRSPDGKWEAAVTVSPVFGPFNANVEAGVARDVGFCKLYLQFNSGYRETQYDWARGSRPAPCLRAGVLFGSLFK